MVREYSSTSGAISSNFFQGTFVGICNLKLSRKAKDYTNLYGKSLHDEDGSLTRHLKNAFAEGCQKLTSD
jgi:hypothetical protein